MHVQVFIVVSQPRGNLSSITPNMSNINYFELLYSALLSIFATKVNLSMKH